jgi:hypothetical protein
MAFPAIQSQNMPLHAALANSTSLRRKDGSTWMTQERSKLHRSSFHFTRIQPVHGIDPSEQIRMEWWSSVNENLLNVNINLDTYGS